MLASYISSSFLFVSSNIKWRSCPYQLLSGLLFFWCESLPFERSHLVQTAHVNSPPSTYGRHGSDAHTPSTWYSNAPFFFFFFCACYHRHTHVYHRHRWTHLNACDQNVQSSDTHDTLWSIQMDSHSLRASLALNHVTWRSKEHRELHDCANFCRKDFCCIYVLHTRCRKRISRTAGHFGTCRTLGCEEDKVRYCDPQP